LLRIEYIGDYLLKSPLEAEPRPGGSVKANIVRTQRQLELTLFEGRPAGVFVMAQFPLAACLTIREALSAYAEHRTFEPVSRQPFGLT